jgi:hypothetical protein
MFPTSACRPDSSRCEPGAAIHRRSPPPHQGTACSSTTWPATRAMARRASRHTSPSVAASGAQTRFRTRSCTPPAPARARSAGGSSWWRCLHCLRLNLLPLMGAFSANSSALGHGIYLSHMITLPGRCFSLVCLGVLAVGAIGNRRLVLCFISLEPEGDASRDERGGGLSAVPVCRNTPSRPRSILDVTTAEWAVPSLLTPRWAQPNGSAESSST